MNRRFFLSGCAGTALLSGCSNGKFRHYFGPRVTGVIVTKSTRQMHLVHKGEVLRSYLVDLGRAPAGPKQFEGDGKTPEGVYTIDRRNPDSSFHLSLGVSYPNARDKAFAAAMGRAPGGDIFIHGEPTRNRSIDASAPDWTEGCIAVTNREIEEIYAMVKDGTPIVIHP